MINNALLFIRNSLNSSIQESFQPRVELGNVALVDAYHDISSGDLSDKVIISLVNVEEEKTLKNSHIVKTTTLPNGDVTVSKQRAPIYLNLYVLFAVNLRRYEDALDYLSRIIIFFQKQNVFEGQSYPELSAVNIERMVFDLYSLRFEELNQMWGVLGGKYVPSVLYRIRLIALQDAPEVPAGIITKAKTINALN